MDKVWVCVSQSTCSDFSLDHDVDFSIDELNQTVYQGNPLTTSMERSTSSQTVYVVAFSPSPFSIAPPFLAHRCLSMTATHCARHGIGKESAKWFGVRRASFLLYKHSATTADWCDAGATIDIYSTPRQPLDDALLKIFDCHVESILERRPSRGMAICWCA